MAIALNKGESFQPGEVWMTPKGGLYKVMGYEDKPGKPKQAVLRVGSDGAGRKVLRDWDAVVGWVIRSPLGEQEVLQKLKAGYELANRGTGWWLSTPRKAYQSQDAVQLEDALVASMEAAGVIEVKMLTTSARAQLIENK